MNWFDITSLIGGILLALSLIGLGLFSLQHKKLQKGLLLLLAGIFTVLLVCYGISTPQL